MLRKLMSAVLLLSIMVTGASAVSVTTSGGTGSTAVETTADAVGFNVTVPTSVLIYMDADGRVTVGEGGSIVNNCAAPVKIKSVTVTAQSGWELVTFGGNMTKAGEKKFALKLNDSPAEAGTGTVEVDNAARFPILPGGNSLDLNWKAEVSPQKQAVTAANIAKVVFVLGLDEAAPVTPAYADYAVLYSDGTLAFQKGSEPRDGYGSVVATYGGDNGGWLTAEYGYGKAPWYSNIGQIQRVKFLDTTAPASTANWFQSCYKLTEFKADGLDLSSVRNMSRMFGECTRLPTVDWNGVKSGQVENMSEMFYRCEALKSVNWGTFDTASVTDMSSMFRQCLSLADIADVKLDTSGAVSMLGMFKSCNITSADMTDWDMSSVESTQFMFEQCDKLTYVDLSTAHTTPHIKSTNFMFSRCTALTTIDLSGWDFSALEISGSMFEGCTLLKTIYTTDDMTNVTSSNSTRMFNSSQNITGGNGTTYNYNRVDSTWARIDKPGQQGYFTLKG